MIPVLEGSFPIHSRQRLKLILKPRVWLCRAHGRRCGQSLRNRWRTSWVHQLVLLDTLLGTNISPEKSVLKMIFLFPRWDMLISWRVFSWGVSKKNSWFYRGCISKRMVAHPWGARSYCEFIPGESQPFNIFVCYMKAIHIEVGQRQVEVPHEKSRGDRSWKAAGSHLQTGGLMWMVGTWYITNLTAK